MRIDRAARPALGQHPLLPPELAKRGFEIPNDEHPIVPVILGDAVRSAKVAEVMLQRGVYAVAFSYPVVPMGRARIRTQVSAAHSRDDLQFAAQTLADACTEVP